MDNAYKDNFQKVSYRKDDPNNHAQKQSSESFPN